MSDMPAREISELTRRDIIDELSLGPNPITGQMPDDDFMARLYKLDELPSTDYRFKTAAGDIWQHRVNNPTDWPDTWMFDDGRFALRSAPDQEFVRFLSETVHPAVRSDRGQTEALLKMYNRLLEPDGWEIAQVSEISGRPIYGGRRLGNKAPAISGAQSVAAAFGKGYLSQQVNRMERAVITGDSELAFGTAKEFVETIAKTLLIERNVPIPADLDYDDFQKVVRFTLKQLPLVRPEIVATPEGAEVAAELPKLLNNLGSIVNSLRTMRNTFGTGHGKDASHVGLGEHHARLAVNIASALGTFMYEAHMDERRDVAASPELPPSDDDDVPF